jgi:hypothetical protein
MNLHQPSANASVLRTYFSLHFVTAVVIMVVAAILVGPVAWSMNFRQAKAAIPLRKPLSAMDVDRLHPYRVVDRATLDAVVVDALGTDQYIQWMLEDTSLLPGDPLRDAQLFVTYDTGGQNLVPHVPDECRLGAGYQPARPHENRDVHLDSPTMAKDIPLRICTFVKTAVFQRDEQTVTYLFHSNGEFAATRDAVRIRFNDPRDRFGYFSKVEISFPRANREESVNGAVKLLGKLLPVLVANHWPDFEAAQNAAGK